MTARNGDGDRPLERAPTTHTVEVGSRSLVADRSSGEVRQLDERATLIWRLVDGTHTVDAIVDHLGEAVDVGRAELDRDVRSFVDALAVTGLVVHGEERDAGCSCATGGGAVTAAVGDRGSGRARIGTAMRALVLDLAAVEAVAALREAAIDPILLKGAALAEWLYEASGERYYSDVDLLVAPDDDGAARDVLRDLGYRAKAPAAAWFAQHATTWLRETDGTIIDLHTRLSGATVDPETQWRELTGQRASVAVAGAQVDGLTIEGRLVHLCLHLAQDPRGQREKKLEDLRRALDTTPDDRWADAADLARRIGAEGAMDAGLRHLPEGAQLADRLGLAPPEDVEVLLRSGGSPHGALALLRMLRAPSVRAALGQARWILFPPADYLHRWVPFVVATRRDRVRARLYRLRYVASYARGALGAVLRTGWRSWWGRNPR